MKKETNASAELRKYLSEYSENIQEIALEALKSLRHTMPGAHQLVFNNYNALVVAFSPSNKTSDCHISIALYPRWVNLFFAKGAGLPDPDKRLQGSGKLMRHLVLKSPEDIKARAVKKLLEAALAGHEELIDPAACGELIIKSVAKTLRPRR